jgi:hypothetical protein
MNGSLWTADRNTHLKIVTLSLLIAIAIVAVGLNAQLSDTVTTYVQVDRGVVKDAKSIIFTANDVSKIP